MKRRNFLKTAAAALPLALADPLASALEPETAPAPPIHLVRAHDDRFGETHSPGYTELLFKTSTAETPSVFAIEHTKIMPGWGPPLHLHLAQEEWFYVIDGQVLAQVGDRRVTLNPGDSILGPRNVPHAFMAIGPAPAHMLITFTPAGHMEQFFRDTVAVGPRQAASVFSRYGMKLVGPPLSPS
ncbi:MAG TPA: cupin domain-containing protein [Candidatus Aquilonibacter sp.]|nr:cupin domain-containing protein [Candidatus Aquilonibacter sp.]